MTGEELALLLRPLDLTPQHVADATGYSRGAVTHWLKRNQQIPPQALATLIPLLAQAHQAKLDELATIGQILPLESAYATSRGCAGRMASS